MSLWMSGLIYGSEEGRSRTAVTHLALARSQNTRNGILGFYKRIISYKSETDFLCDTKDKISEFTKEAADKSCSFFSYLSIQKGCRWQAF